MTLTKECEALLDAAAAEAVAAEICQQGKELPYEIAGIGAYLDNVKASLDKALGAHAELLYKLLALLRCELPRRFFGVARVHSRRPYADLAEILAAGAVAPLMQELSHDLRSFGVYRVGKALEAVNKLVGIELHHVVVGIVVGVYLHRADIYKTHAASGTLVEKTLSCDRLPRPYPHRRSRSPRVP